MAGSPLRIAMFGNFVSETLGGMTVSEDLATRLAARGHTVVRASRHVARAPRLADMLWKAVAHGPRYDVAHVDLLSGLGFRLAELVCATLRVMRKPYILTLHGGGLPDFAARHPRRVTRMLSSASAVVAPSRYMADSMARYRDGIRVIPNVIELTAYTSRVRQSCAPRLLWLRSFKSMYNPRLALQTLAALAPRYPDAALTMAGPDRNDGSLESFLDEASRLGVRDRIVITGNVAKGDIPALLDSHDIFLNTSNLDNTPVSMIEAMASGLCAVSTRVGGVPYLCRDGIDALLVPAADAAAMSGACARLLDDPRLAAAVSAEAIRAVRAFDVEQGLDSWESLFRSTASSQ